MSIALCSLHRGERSLISFYPPRARFLRRGATHHKFSADVRLVRRRSDHVLPKKHRSSPQTNTSLSCVLCPHSCTSGNTSQSVTHPKIALGYARLTQRFLRDRLPKNKMHLVGMSILSILLSIEPGYHNPPLIRRLTSSSVNPKLGTFPPGHVCVSSVVICHAMCPLQAHIRHTSYGRSRVIF
jgi:hypothetical protein